MITATIQDTIYSGIIKSMQIDNAPWIPPKGPFYLLDGVVVPFSPNPTILRIETDRVGEAINIEIEQFGDFGSGTDVRKKQTNTTVVATSSVVTTGVQLGQGKNLIAVSVMNRPSDVAYVLVNATTIVALWESFARVLYSSSTRIIDEQKRAISSELATRLIEPFLSFQELLPDIQSVKILSIRLATKGLIHSVGTNLGVQELLKSLTLTTPVYHSMDKDSYELFPALDPWTKSASQYSGQEAHVWIPNVEIASWLAFLSFISNQPDLYQIQHISESEVVIVYQGDQQRHYFDFNNLRSSFLSAQASSECFKSVIINATMTSQQWISMCVGTYTFDLRITEKNLLGDSRPNLDFDLPFDNNYPFDADPIDPFTDGWIDLSLSGRFEQDYPLMHVLDTFIVPSTTYPSICGYEGWYTQMVKNHKYDIDVPVDITVTGLLQEGLVWLLVSPIGDTWMVTVNHLTNTISTKIVVVSTPIINYKVLKPDLTEVAFDITDDGVLQVITPLGGEELTDTLYISSDDQTSVWWVKVNNENVITIDQIFPV
jgi:hypothetical protein